MHWHVCACLRSCAPCQSLMDYGNTKTPSMHCRLNNMTVAAGFPWGKWPKFPMEEILMGQCSCKKKKKNVTLFCSTKEDLSAFLMLCSSVPGLWPQLFLHCNLHRGSHQAPRQVPESLNMSVCTGVHSCKHESKVHRTNEREVFLWSHVTRL